MKLLRACLLLCLLLGKLSLGWAAPVVLDDHPRGLSLNETGQLLALTDNLGTLTLDEILQPAQTARFAPVPPAQQHSPSEKPRWFKVQLEQRAQTGDWVLATQTTALQDARFHGPFDATGRALAAPVHTGLSQPFASRPLGSERYLMRLQLPGPGVYTVYVRLQGGTAPTLGLSTWDTAEYLQWRQHKRLFDGICYGILIALLVYNLVLAGIFRDPAYTFYIGQCACALLTLASFNGHAAHYLWGDWPWWQERSNVVLPGLWLIFGVLFARSFLDTPRRPRVDRPLQALALVAAAASLLGLLGWFALAQKANEIIASLGALTATVSAVIILRRGFKPARWYLGGQALLFLSVLGVVLVNWKLIDSPFLLANGLQLGVAAEMVVFAVAMSRRISGLRTSQVALQLHAAHLAQAAATDPLTGLANRTGLAQGATRVLTGGSAHALMLLDLDRFKPINDTYGHDAGDAVLCAVAKRLLAHARPGDIVARLGGDEFVILLADAPPDVALAALALRLDAAVRQSVDFQGQPLSVGASTGIARSPQDGSTLTELMRAADQAMYQAKQARRGHAFYTAA